MTILKVNPPDLGLHVIEVTSFDQEVIDQVILAPNVGSVHVVKDGENVAFFQFIPNAGHPTGTRLTLEGRYWYLIEFSDGGVARATWDQVRDVLKACKQEFA